MPMGDIQRLNIDGKGYVLMPENEYEDLVDVARAREIKAAGEESFPSEVVNALLAGENAVRVFRKHRGLTMAQLGEKAGVSQPYIAGLESGKREGTVATLKALAAALGVDLEDLV
jgi:DNA-binding XRE family transcriptional regulator